MADITFREFAGWALTALALAPMILGLGWGLVEHFWPASDPSRAKRLNASPMRSRLATLTIPTRRFHRGRGSVVPLGRRGAGQMAAGAEGVAETLSLDVLFNFKVKNSSSSGKRREIWRSASFYAQWCHSSLCHNRATTNP